MNDMFTFFKTKKSVGLANSLMKRDVEIISSSDLFDGDWYLKEYPDVRDAGLNPAEHYLLHGAEENRKPSLHFDGSLYLDLYPDVKASGMNPLLHYLAFGIQEGRFLEQNRNSSSGVIRSRAGDLVQKLWGGFSKSALEELKKIRGNKKYTSTDRIAANYALARWHATQGEWPLTKSHLNRIKVDSVNFYRSKRVKLLLIEANLNLNELSSAQEIIDFALDNKVDADFVCAKSNLLARVMPNESDGERLDALNSIYEHQGLSPIRLLNAEKGLEFGNIAYKSEIPCSFSGPKISVLMPVYNAEDFVHVAVHSILNQTWKNLELIAVDDCSTDRSYEILLELAKSDDRLRVYKNEQNSGAYPTRNKALSFATGDFITVHDSDDWSHPQMLEVQLGAMMSNPKLKLTCSFMARVHPDLSFILRPQRENLDFVHRSYPSLLIRKTDLDLLGEWDAVSANADDELLQRVWALWGKESTLDVLPGVPLSLFLVHENSLTQQKGTSLNSLTFGIRHEYARQAKYWREKHADSGDLIHKRVNQKDPFPIPAGLCPKNWQINREYDLVIVSDLSLLGGTRRCNEGYIKAAINKGMRVGLFHWPRYDLKLAPIDDIYTEFSYLDEVDFLVPEDQVSAEAVLIHHPPILKYEIDAVPGIQTNKLGILVNQSPMQLWSQEPHYYFEEPVIALCEELFGQRPVWIPISPRVQRTLSMSGDYKNVQPECWYPPLSVDLSGKMPNFPTDLGGDRPIVVGRHCRDHWTKWPDNKKELSQAYLADADGISMRFMGGATTAINILDYTPSNWDVEQFDAMSVSDFVNSLDFFIHYTNDDYIEEFGRNIMEAMAAGRVVILPPEYQEIFQDAAVYCRPEEVEESLKKYWSNIDLYRAQAALGYEYVQKNCSLSVIGERIEKFASQT